jgi:hypothetical protein
VRVGWCWVLRVPWFLVLKLLWLLRLLLPVDLDLRQLDLLGERFQMDGPELLLLGLN